MTSDVAITVELDHADLQDAECPSCLGTRSVRDDETGASRPCSRCAPSSTATTLELDVQTPEVVRRSVVDELDGPPLPDGRRSMLSPMGTLCRWAREYLEAERSFRATWTRFAAEVDGAPGASVDELRAAIRRVATAELTLRDATGVADGPSDFPGLLTDRVAFVGALRSIRRDARQVSIVEVPEDLTGRLSTGWLRRVLGRLRRWAGRR